MELYRHSPLTPSELVQGQVYLYYLHPVPLCFIRSKLARVAVTLVGTGEAIGWNPEKISEIFFW